MVDEPKVTLIVQDGVVDYDQAHYALQRFPFTIGRDPGCDLVLPLNSILSIIAGISRRAEQRGARARRFARQASAWSRG